MGAPVLPTPRAHRRFMPPEDQGRELVTPVGRLALEAVAATLGADRPDVTIADAVRKITNQVDRGSRRVIAEAIRARLDAAGVPAEDERAWRDLADMLRWRSEASGASRRTTLAPPEAHPYAMPDEIR